MGFKPFHSFLLLVFVVLGILAAAVSGRSVSLSFWPAAFLLSAAAVWGGLTLARGYHGRSSLRALWTAFGFVVWVLLRALATYYHDGVPYLARQEILFVAAGFLAYVLITAHLERNLERRWILAALIVAVLLNAGIAFVQWRNDPSYQFQAQFAKRFPGIGDFLGWTEWSRTAMKSEVAGCFQSENHLAGFLAMLGPLLLGYILIAKAGWFLRFAAFVGVAASGFAVYWSTSRAGMGCYFGGLISVALIWFFWSREVKTGKSPKRLLLVSVLVLGILGGGAAGMYAKLKQDYQAHGIFNADQIKSRMVHTKLAWEQFLKSPIVGTGSRSYEYEERSLRSLSFEDWNWYTDTDIDGVFAHNDWFQLLGDYGFLGWGLALAVLVTHLASALQLLARTAKKPDEDGNRERAGLAAGALAGMLAMALYSIIDFNLHIGTNVVIMALLLGILANPGRVTIEQKFDAEGMPLIPRHGLLLRPLMIVVSVICAGGIFLHGPDLLKSDRETRRGERMAEEQDYYEATTAFQAAWEADPNNYKAAMGAGELNVEEALRGFEQVTPRTPAKQVDLLIKIRNSHLRRGIDWYARAYAAYPQYPYSAMGAGYSYSLMADFENAEAWYQRAFEYGKASRSLAMDYGEHLFRRALASADPNGRIHFLDKALSYFEPALNKFRAAAPEKERLIELIRLAKEFRKEVENAKLNPPSSAPDEPKTTPTNPPSEPTPAPAPPAPPPPASAPPPAPDPGKTVKPLVPATPP